MKNIKGFTLTEVLATIVILGVILMIAVPSVTNLNNKSKEKQINEDAKIFKALVKNKIEKDTSIDITSDAKFTLKSIDKNQLSGNYKEDSSYVLVKKDSCGYDTNDNYTCGSYKVYLYPEVGSYGYEEFYKDAITTPSEHNCNDKEWC